MTENKRSFYLKLCAIDSKMIEAWKREFTDTPLVKIHHGDIMEQAGTALVSPANSFGFMDGGLDMLISHEFGWELQERLQNIIREKYHGELLVGQAVTIETLNKKVPYLISAPTMRIPTVLEGGVNPYLAARAVFIEVIRFNKNVSPPDLPIKTVLMPSFGTGVGRVPFHVCARQMKAAYNDIVLDKFNSPEKFTDAQHRDWWLSNADRDIE